MINKLILPITILQLSFLLPRGDCYAQDFVKADVHGWTMFVTLAPDGYTHGQAQIDTFRIGDMINIEFDQAMTRQANQTENNLNTVGLSLVHQQFFPANDNTWLTNDPLLNQGAVPVATLDLQRGLYAVQLRTVLKPVSEDGTVNPEESQRSEPLWFYVMPPDGDAPAYPGNIKIRIGQ